MANLRGSIRGYRKTGTATETSRLASESISAQVNTWDINLRIWLNKDGEWSFVAENYNTGEQIVRLNSKEVNQINEDPSFSGQN